MKTVHVSIGNSDGKLDHAEWAAYYRDADELLTGALAVRVYGAWHSLPATGFVNACWAIEVLAEDVEPLKGALRQLASRYNQDSIAWLAGVTEFISAP